MTTVCPSTPPRVLPCDKSQKPPFQGMQTPSTPNSKKESTAFTTPSTSTKQKASSCAAKTERDAAIAASFKTPVSVAKKPLLSIIGKTLSLLPISPAFTPHRPSADASAPTADEQVHIMSSIKTPTITSTPTTSAPVVCNNNATATFAKRAASMRKRKVFTSDYLFQHSSAVSSEDRIAFGSLLPVPSTIGTGRSGARNSSGLKLPMFGKRIDGVISLEEDVSDEVDSLFSINSNNSEEDKVDSAAEPPSTPKLQMICDDLVSHWHGKSYNNQYSSDEESDVEINDRKPILVNPFLVDAMKAAAKRNQKKNPFRDVSDVEDIEGFFNSPIHDETKLRINYDTHMEYMNNKTGERRVVKLSSRQMKIKPKKLDFSQV